MVVALLARLAIGSFAVTAQVPNDTSVKAYLELLSRYEHGEHEEVALEAYRLDAATARALAVRVFDDIEIEMVRPQNRDLATQDRLRVERLRRLTLTLLGWDGPKLLLVLTDGRNNASWLQAGAVIDAARRHETVVYPVAVGPDRRWPSRVSWFRRTSDSLALLQEIADQTGGRQVDADWDRTVGDVFQAILREYRQRYIVSFTPTGVGSGDAWHDLEVRVKRRGATVRARTRYWSGPKN